ncbi:hypothetical protein JCM8097_001108 [Rhodosporidiobolus ruineniae]
MAWSDPPKERTGRGPVFLLLGGGAFVLLLTLQYLFSSDSTAHHTSSSTNRLSSFLHVPASWSSCGIDADLVKEYGTYNIKLSRVHEGTGYRVQRFLRKLENGEKVKIAVIGGSVSTGHGTAEDGTLHSYGAIKKTWHHHVSSWINATYGGQEYLNGAMPATDSSFFRFCWSDRVKLEEAAPDLVMIEMDINDFFSEEDRNWSEELLRSILLLPNKPAVINAGTFSLTNGYLSLLNAGDNRAMLSNFYDVPQISMRNPLLNAVWRNNSLAAPFFNGDPAHAAAPLHKYLGDMVVAYLQEQRCQTVWDQKVVEPENAFWPDSKLVGEVPERLVTEGWQSQITHPTAAPSCRLAGFTLKAAAQDDTWQPYSWMETKHYLITAVSGAKIEFDVTVPEGGMGFVGIGFLRSLGYNLGRLRCTVGGQEAVLDGHWARTVSLTKVEPVARNLAPGPYRLVCTSEAGDDPAWTAFRIGSVVGA